MRKAPFAFVTLGIAFVAIGIATQRVFIFVGIAFLVVAFIGLRRLRS